MGDHDDRAALVQQALEFRGAAHDARVGEPELRAAKVVQARVVGRAGDREHDERAAHGGGAEGVHGDPVAGAREGLVVGGQVVPVGEPAGGAAARVAATASSKRRMVGSRKSLSFRAGCSRALAAPWASLPTQRPSTARPT